MALPIVVFLVVSGLVLGVASLMRRRSSAAASRQLLQRLKEVGESNQAVSSAIAVVRRTGQGAVPALDRLVAGTRAGSRLSDLIQQAGLTMAPGSIIAACLGAGAGAGFLAFLFVRHWFAMPIAAAIGGCVPFWWLKHKASSRMKKFEEQFPEVLELLSRALKAGHAFQTALGMAATEMKAPAGAEFKKTFDEQNFGLPLKDALENLTVRIPLLDVRFFATAVMIQRETGGNLAEILENLGHVVRERFKILRQVRVYTAHGRFTGYVLLALPAVLGIALSFINPDHMNLLFRERMGHMLLLSALVLQTIGFLWIKRVIKIEV